MFTASLRSNPVGTESRGPARSMNSWPRIKEVRPITLSPRDRCSKPSSLQVIAQSSLHCSDPMTARRHEALFLNPSPCMKGTLRVLQKFASCLASFISQVLAHESNFALSEGPQSNGPGTSRTSPSAMRRCGSSHVARLMCSAA